MLASFVGAESMRYPVVSLEGSSKSLCRVEITVAADVELFNRCRDGEIGLRPPYGRLSTHLRPEQDTQHRNRLPVSPKAGCEASSSSGSIRGASSRATLPVVLAPILGS